MCIRDSFFTIVALLLRYYYRCHVPVRYPTSIASLAFTNDGTVLAVAASYMHEHDVQPENVPEDAVYIRNVTDQETKPK